MTFGSPDVLTADRRLNVLRIITWLPVGGIERRLVATLPKFDRSRFNVQLACIRERGPLADELAAAGIPVHFIPFRKLFDLAGLRQLAALMREQKIDVVHSHMYRSNVAAAVAGRMAGVRAVWGQIHNVGTCRTRRQAWIDHHLCRWRTGMIAVSESVKRDMMSTLALPSDRVTVIRNGIDLTRFRHTPARREAVRARENVGPGHFVYMFAARLVPQKRCGAFLDAFSQLQQSDGGEQLRAWICGDGPERDELERRARALRYPDAVRFFGQQDHVEDFYAAADVFVLPSSKEGFSNALVEAMASGLSCIATNVGGNEEALGTTGAGILIPPSNVARLAEAMRLVWQEPGQRQVMSTQAAARAKCFGIEKMLNDLERLYLDSVSWRGHDR